MGLKWQPRTNIIDVFFLESNVSHIFIFLTTFHRTLGLPTESPRSGMLTQIYSKRNCINLASMWTIFRHHTYRPSTLYLEVHQTMTVHLARTNCPLTVGIFPSISTSTLHRLLYIFKPRGLTLYNYYITFSPYSSWHSLHLLSTYCLL